MLKGKKSTLVKAGIKAESKDQNIESQQPVNFSSVGVEQGMCISFLTRCVQGFRNIDMVGLLEGASGSLNNTARNEVDICGRVPAKKAISACLNEHSAKQSDFFFF